ncbi:MAG: IS4 family transposase [uncultured bacterium]|nr:MAG: IS4 family transposase [uncultured bacterium]
MTAVLEKKRYPSDLSHKQWKILEPLIPPAKPGGRPREHSMKDILAIWYKVKTGCQWRQLPNDYPPWRTVYEYFKNWSLDDTWLAIHDEIVRLVRKKKEKTNLRQLQLLTANLLKQQLQKKTRDMMVVKR